MSGMVREQTLATRHRAVGTVEAGITVGDVSRQVGVSRQTLYYWLALDHNGASLDNHKDCRSQTVLSRLSKIVFTKVVLKRRQSTRKLGKY